MTHGVPKTPDSQGNTTPEVGKRGAKRPLSLHRVQKRQAIDPIVLEEENTEDSNYEDLTLSPEQSTSRSSRSSSEISIVSVASHQEEDVEFIGEVIDVEATTAMSEEDSDSYDEEYESSSEESMDPSEALARQLQSMEEEIYMQELAYLQQQAILQEHGGLLSHQAAALLYGETGHAQPNVDGMDYDELVQLGEQLGDVSKERWRKRAAREIAKIEIKFYRKNEREFKGKEDKCVVCQYEFETDESVKELKCGHLFHAECIDTWLKDNNSCVICKTPIAKHD